MKSTGVVVAKQSFAVGSTVVRKGTTYREGHPVTEGREEFFKPFVPDNEIEQATAAPGEKRNTRIRKESKSETAESAEEKADEPAADQTAANADTSDYSELKQPELKALLDERGIEYPTGVVSNAALIALLESKSGTA